MTWEPIDWNRVQRPDDRVIRVAVGVDPDAPSPPSEWPDRQAPWMPPVGWPDPHTPWMWRGRPTRRHVHSEVCERRFTGVFVARGMYPTRVTVGVDDVVLSLVVDVGTWAALASGRMVVDRVGCHRFSPERWTAAFRSALTN